MSNESALNIGEAFVGEGVNAAHTNVLVGPREGPAGQAFASSLASPSAGHVPFMVVAQPGVPVRPLTLFVNKAAIAGELHGDATWGAAQAGIAVGVHRAVTEGVLPPEAPYEWVIVAAVWVNPGCDDLDQVFANQRDAAHRAIVAAQRQLPSWEQVDQAARAPRNPFYTPPSD